jgi:predicted Zn-dependent protease
MKRVIPLVLMLVFFLSSPLWAEMSERQRQALSDRMMADITKAHGKERELDPGEPLMVVFNNLVTHGRRKGIKYRLRVVESKTVNAYAMPDGRIVFYSGLINNLPGDDMNPLAWVAGHEISHVEMRHGEKKFTQALTTGIFLSLLTGGCSDWVKGLAAVSEGILVSGYSRDKEYEADRGGLMLMREAGYDPAGALTTLKLFDDMAKKRKDLRIFPSHPRACDRSKSVMAWMEKNGLAAACSTPVNQNGNEPAPSQPCTGRSAANDHPLPTVQETRKAATRSVEFPQDAPPPMP